jgi:hypothetical protein
MQLVDLADVELAKLILSHPPDLCQVGFLAFRRIKII